MRAHAVPHNVLRMEGTAQSHYKADGDQQHDQTQDHNLPEHFAESTRDVSSTRALW